MIKKILLTIIISALILAIIVFGVMGANNELPWGWLNITVQVIWVLFFIAIIVFDVWDKLD